MPSHRSEARHAALALVLLAATAAAQADLADFAKDVAAPPADILDGTVVLPRPEDTAVASRAQVRAVEPRWIEARGWTVESEVAVDEAGPLALALLTPAPVEWRWTLVDPSGRELDLALLVATAGARRERRDALAEAGGASGDRLDVDAAVAGTWTVRSVAVGAARSTPPPSAWLVARSAGTARLVAHASTLETRSDVDVAVIARFEDAADIGSVRGTAVLEFAGGTATLALADDGRSLDGPASDGIFGALVPRATSGDVRVRVEMSGTRADGAPVARTAQIAFPVIERRAVLTGVAEARAGADGRVAIRIEAFPLGPPAKLHVSAEVWGTSADGRAIPVCWLSRMQVPEERVGLLDLELSLDTRWIDLAAARAPFVLRRVRMQDPDTHVPHDVADSVAFAMPALPVQRAPVPASPTIEMLQGSTISATRVVPLAPASPVLLNPALVLVHGYCSSGSIWPAAHFTQPKLEFLDPDANRTHDQFALLLRQATAALTSFGVVGHSQGGMAALHLYTYYASGLDRAMGPRLIQSVASPYLGTPLASWGGFACGTNGDMTISGGPTWLAGIPTWAREKVYFWTTSNSGSACNFFASLLLDDPEDGTTEMMRGQLAGANSMGHVVGWCHTTGMSNPASYTDAVRNAERNAQAAR